MAQAITTVAIDKIVITAGTQIRVVIDQKTVGDYAEAAGNQEIFPPVDVFHDGATYWLVDGFHRYWAAMKRKAKTMRCHVHAGDLRDAILFACGANHGHGLRRTNEDKRNSVVRLLTDDEWAKMSDAWLAGKAKVSESMVAKYRPEQVHTVGTCPPPRTGIDGKTYPSKGKPCKKKKLAGGAAEPADITEVAEGATGAPAGEAAPEPGTIEHANAELDRFVGALKEARKVARAVFGIAGQELKAPWLNRFSFMGTAGMLNDMLRMCEDYRPTGGTAAKPRVHRDEKRTEALAK